MANNSQAPRSNRKIWTTVILAVVGVLVIGGGVGVAAASNWEPLAGITGSDGRSADKPASQESATPAPVAKKVSLELTPTADALAVNPATTAKIVATNATLEAVVLEPRAGGTAVDGNLSADGSTWTATERLSFDTDYQYRFTVVDSLGEKSEKRQGFSTVAPANEANAFLFPSDGSTVGTGQPLEITFSEPVTNREAVQDAIAITSSSGQEGAFYWLSDTKVRYRAQDFWAPNSTITVDMKLFGVDFGNGMIGNFDQKFTIRTHNTRLAVVDDATKTMQVFIDGQLQRTFPVTLGTKEWPSTMGYHVVMENYASTKFTAESIGLKPGDKAYYPPTVVKHATRLTNGGAFVHEALPAAQSVLGVMNVSHGCVGMSPEGAKYFYDNFGPGDVVEVRNTNYGPMYVWDGFGDWNLSWAEYSGRP